MRTLPSSLSFLGPTPDPLGCSEPWCSLVGMGELEHSGFEEFVPGRSIEQGRVILTRLTEACNVVFPITPRAGDVAFVDTISNDAPTCSEEQVMSKMKRHLGEIHSVVLPEHRCPCESDELPSSFRASCKFDQLGCTNIITPIDVSLAHFEIGIYRLNRWDAQRVLDCLHGTTSQALGDSAHPSLSGIQCSSSQSVQILIKQQVPAPTIVHGAQVANLGLFRATLHRILSTDLLRNPDFIQMLDAFGHHVNFTPRFLVHDKSRTQCGSNPQYCATECIEDGGKHEFCLTHHNLGATGKQLVEETIRHVCVWEETLSSDHGHQRLVRYVSYVNEMESKCQVTATAECSKLVHETLGYNWDTTNTCFNSKGHTLLREQVKHMGAVYYSPSITVNGVYVPLQQVSELEVATSICKYGLDKQSSGYPTKLCDCVVSYEGVEDKDGVEDCWQIHSDHWHPLTVLVFVVLLISIVSAVVVVLRTAYKRRKLGKSRAQMEQTVVDEMGEELEAMPDSIEANSIAEALDDTSSPAKVSRSISQRLKGAVSKTALQKEQEEEQPPLVEHTDEVVADSNDDDSDEEHAQGIAQV